MIPHRRGSRDSPEQDQESQNAGARAPEENSESRLPHFDPRYPAQGQHHDDDMQYIARTMQSMRNQQSNNPSQISPYANYEDAPGTYPFYQRPPGDEVNRLNPSLQFQPHLPSYEQQSRPQVNLNRMHDTQQYQYINYPMNQGMQNRAYLAEPNEMGLQSPPNFSYGFNVRTGEQIVTPDRENTTAANNLAYSHQAMGNRPKRPRTISSGRGHSLSRHDHSYDPPYSSTSAPSNANATIQREPKIDHRRKVKSEDEIEVLCRCVKSRCLKLYCECFQRGTLCHTLCKCVDCLNTPNEAGKNGKLTRTKEEYLLRKPDAFGVKKKVVGKGCACKNNRCLKKYCDCFNHGISCTDKCACADCQNRGVSGSKRDADTLVSASDSSSPKTQK